MSQVSLRTAVDQFLYRLSQEGSLGKATQDAYKRDLNALVEWCQHQGTDGLDQIDTHTIRAFAASEHRRGLSPRSIQRRISGCRRFFRSLRQQGLIKTDPSDGVKAPKVRRKLPETLDIDQIMALLEIPDDSDLAIRDRAMLELFYASGLRVSELVALKWQDLDLTEGLVRVLGKGNKERLVPVGRHALAALSRWRSLQPENTVHIFTNPKGRHLTVRALQKRVAYWSERQGLDQHVHPHQLRHSFASHILQSSGDLRAVQELLGHANLTTTQIYTHLDYQHLAKVYDQTHPRAKKSK